VKNMGPRAGPIPGRDLTKTSVPDRQGVLAGPQAGGGDVLDCVVAGEGTQH